MRLRNKKTGEIEELIVVRKVTGCDGRAGLEEVCTTLPELNEEWEDYEDPKWSWYIDWNGEIKRCDRRIYALLKFATKEESEKAVEKLKAWQRLEDKGFRFTGYTDDSGDLFSCQVIRCRFDDFGEESRKDLDLLFGGEG